MCWSLTSTSGGEPKSPASPHTRRTGGAAALSVLAGGGAVVVRVGPLLAEADDVGQLPVAAVPEGVVDLVSGGCVWYALFVRVGRHHGDNCMYVVGALCLVSHLAAAEGPVGVLLEAEVGGHQGGEGGVGGIADGALFMFWGVGVSIVGVSGSGPLIRWTIGLQNK